MIQRTFFDLPIARKSDPPTSHAAATAIAPKLSLRQAECLAWIIQHPDCTAAEMEAKCGNVHLRKRIPELAAKGLIFKSGVRESSVSKCDGTQWRAV